MAFFLLGFLSERHMRKQNDQWKDKDKFPVHSIRIMMHKINEFKNVPEQKGKRLHSLMNLFTSQPKW